MPGRFVPSLAQIATAIWSLVALASRTVTASVVSDKTGYSVSSVGDKTGYSIVANSDKTGYSLTAGSYSPIKSIQHGSTTITAGNTSNTSAISAVNTAKAFIIVRNFGDGSGGTNAGTIALTNGTTVTYTRSSSSGSSTADWTVVEFF